METTDPSGPHSCTFGKTLAAPIIFMYNLENPISSTHKRSNAYSIQENNPERSPGFSGDTYGNQNQADKRKGFNGITV